MNSNFNYRNGTLNPLKTATRKTFTDDERNELIRVFEKNPYLKRNTMEKLALKMGVPFHNINIWFKNARRYNRVMTRNTEYIDVSTLIMLSRWL